ncbi:MAG: PilZ domain-containing protein [Syntrophobacteraceae bacterium]
MEKRKNRRVHFEVVATVLSGPISINGTVDNLSMKGMFLNTRERLSGDSALKVSMTLPGSSSILSMELKGRALRQTETGIAIEFQEMDLDSFIHLRNIVAINSDDADAVYKEYCESIKTK